MATNLVRFDMGGGVDGDMSGGARWGVVEGVATERDPDQRIGYRHTLGLNEFVERLDELVGDGRGEPIQVVEMAVKGPFRHPRLIDHLVDRDRLHGRLENRSFAAATKWSSGAVKPCRQGPGRGTGAAPSHAVSQPSRAMTWHRHACFFPDDRRGVALPDAGCGQNTAGGLRTGARPASPPARRFRGP